MLRGNLPTCFRLFSHASRHSFRLSFRLLLHYRTPDVFRLGRFALPYWAGSFDPTYSISDDQRIFAYGTVTLFSVLFQRASAQCVEVLCRRHIYPYFRRGIRLGLCPFHSPLLRVSRLLSLPAPTMMLRFRAFPLGTPLEEQVVTIPDRSRVRSRSHALSVFPGAGGLPRHEVAFGHPRIAGCLRLPGAYRSLPRPSSAPEPRHPHAGACVSDGRMSE